MYLLDTDVLSELMRQSPDETVMRWLDARSPMDLWISAITVAEIRLGVAILPDGRRRMILAGQIENMFTR